MTQPAEAPAVTPTPATPPAAPPAPALDPATMPLPPVPGLEAPAPEGEPEGGRAVVDSLGEPAPAKTKLEQALEAAAKITAKGQARRREREMRIAADQRARQAESQLAMQRAETQRLAREQEATRALLQQPEDNSPEGRIARAEAQARATQAQFEQLQRDLAENNQRASLAAAHQAFERDAVQGESDFPHVVSHLEVRRAGVIAEAEAVTRWALSQGEQWSHRKVLKYLEGEYRKADEKARTRGGAKAADGAATPGGGATSGGHGGPGAKTLTNRVTERAQAPTSFDDLDPDDQIAVMARQLKASQTR